MASVDLTQCWIHLGSDLSQTVSMNLLSLQENKESDGDIQNFAGGVRRVITTGDVAREVDISTDYVPRTSYDTIYAWSGLPIMFRDPLGRKIFGAYFEVDAEEVQHANIDTELYRIELTVLESSDTEEV